MKAHSASIKPTMNMDTAANAINIQQDLKVAELNEIVFQEYNKPNKTWSNYPTSTFTTTFGEGIMKQVHDHVLVHKNRSAKRVGASSFQVRYVGKFGELDPNAISGKTFDEFDDDFQEVPIPRFWRILEVTVAKDGTMYCECCGFESTGYFYEECVAVADLVHTSNGKKFEGFTHHDVIVRYLSGYMQLAYRDSTPEHIRQLYHRLALNPPAGPRLRKSIPDSLAIKDRDPILPAVDRLINYKKEDIDFSLVDGMVSTTHSQDSYDMDTDPNDDVDENFFEERRQALFKSISHTCEQMFDVSISNSALPESARSGVRTRDALKQPWEEACDAADGIGWEATRKLESMLDDFREWCNVTRSVNEQGNSQGSGSRRAIPMTQGKYTGTADRVYNTHHMG